MTSLTYPGVGLRHIEAASSYTTWNINCPATAIPQPPTIRYPVAGTNTKKSISLRDLWKDLDDPDSGVNLAHILQSKEISTLPLVGNIRWQTVGCSKLAEELKGNRKKDPNCKWLENNKPFIEENELLEQLQRCFNPERGLILHGYKQSSYMQLIVDHFYASFVYDVEKELSQNWIKVAEMKGIDVTGVLNSKDCKTMADQIRHHLKNFDYKERNAKVNKDTIKAVIPEKLRGEKVKHKDTLPLMLQHYIEQNEEDDPNKSHREICQSITTEIIRRMYVINHIKTEGREVDFLVVLPRLQVILQVEMKYVHDVHTKKAGRIKEHMNNASEQLSHMFEWIRKAHLDLFSDWRYLCVVSFPTIPPTSPLLDSFTDLEKDFMLLQGQNIEHFFYKLTKKYLKVTFPVSSTNVAQSFYDEFVKRVALLASFGGHIRFREREWTKKIHDQIVGPDAPSIMPGASNTDKFPEKATSIAVDKLRLDDISSEEKSVIKVILWSSHQKEILENNPDKVVFRSDFGTGKTLMLKTAAKMAAKYSSTPVYYISLSGAQIGAICNRATLFDISTQQYFINSRVNFMSAESLRQKYKERMSEEVKKKGIDINHFDMRQLVAWQVQDGPESQYFIDELLCTSPGHPDKWITPLHQEHPVVRARVVNGVAMTLSGDGSYKCDVCGQSEAHGEYTGNTYRPYHCKTCMYTMCIYCVHDEITFNMLDELKNNALKKLWVVLRNPFITKSRSQRYEHYFADKFVDCDLPVVQRCCGNITRAANKMMALFQKSPPMGRELDTCSGSQPRVISINKSMDEIFFVLFHLVPKCRKALVAIDLQDSYEWRELMYKSKNLFHQLLPQHKCLLYSQVFSALNDDVGDVLKFFHSSDEGVMFTDVATVSGMEVDVGIFFTDGLRAVHRDVMMRTISDLYFVMIDNQRDYEKLVSYCEFEPYHMSEFHNK